MRQWVVIRARQLVSISFGPIISEGYKTAQCFPILMRTTCSTRIFWLAFYYEGSGRYLLAAIRFYYLWIVQVLLCPRKMFLL